MGGTRPTGPGAHTAPSGACGAPRCPRASSRCKSGSPRCERGSAASWRAGLSRTPWLRDQGRRGSGGGRADSAWLFRRVAVGRPEWQVPVLDRVPAPRRRRREVLDVEPVLLQQEVVTRRPPRVAQGRAAQVELQARRRWRRVRRAVRPLARPSRASEGSESSVGSEASSGAAGGSGSAGPERRERSGARSAKRRRLSGARGPGAAGVAGAGALPCPWPWCRPCAPDLGAGGVTLARPEGTPRGRSLPAGRPRPEAALGSPRMATRVGS